MPKYFLKETGNSIVRDILSLKSLLLSAVVGSYLLLAILAFGTISVTLGSKLALTLLGLIGVYLFIVAIVFFLDSDYN